MNRKVRKKLACKHVYLCYDVTVSPKWLFEELQFCYFFSYAGVHKAHMSFYARAEKFVLLVKERDYLHFWQSIISLYIDMWWLLLFSRRILCPSLRLFTVGFVYSSVYTWASSSFPLITADIHIYHNLVCFSCLSCCFHFSFVFSLCKRFFFWNKGEKLMSYVFAKN